MSTVGSQYTDEQIRNRLQDSEIAGGSAYLDQLSNGEIPTKDQADFVISAGDSASDFFDATNQANDIDDGGLVWVDGDAKIDFSGSSGYVSDCTIVSDRGQNGTGALLYTSDHGQGSHAWDGGPGTGLFTARDNVRFFGLELRGPTHDYWDSPSHPGYIPFKFDELDAGERDDFRSEWSARGINVQGENVTIENCKLWGFSTHGVSVGDHDEDAYYEPTISHCDIHDNMQSGLGYNVNVYRGNPDIEFCYFNASRHTLATFGWWNSGYHIEDSIIGPSTSLFLLDTHSLGENSASESTDPSDKDFVGRASGNIEVRRVTFTPTHVIEDADYDAGQSTNHMSMGGHPWPPDGDGAIIEKCRCAHDSRSDAFYQRTSGDGWSVPEGDDGYSENVTVQDNQYGAPDEPYHEDYGAPLDIRGDGSGSGGSDSGSGDSGGSDEQTTGHLAVFAEDERTGKRITGADVVATRVSDGTTHTGTTENIEIADGGVDFGEVPVGYYQIEVEHDRYEAGTYGEDLWRDEGEEQHQAVHLDDGGRMPIIYLSRKPTPTGQLAVFAEDADTEQRIDGADVTATWLEDEPHPDDDPGPHTGVTSDIDIADGGVDFGQVPSGYYQIEVEHEDYESGTYDSELWRDEGEQTNEALHLSPDGRRLPIIYLPPAESDEEDGENGDGSEPSEPEDPDVPDPGQGDEGDGEDGGGDGGDSGGDGDGDSGGDGEEDTDTPARTTYTATITDDDGEAVGEIEIAVSEEFFD